MYIIQKGDTLSGISKKLGIPIEVILKANPKIQNRDQIRAGDRLITEGGGSKNE